MLTPQNCEMTPTPTEMDAKAQRIRARDPSLRMPLRNIQLSQTSLPHPFPPTAFLTSPSNCSTLKGLNNTAANPSGCARTIE